MLKISIRAHGFNIEHGWTTNVEFEINFPQGLDVQSARGAVREILSGNGKPKRSGGVVITTTMVLGHKFQI
jgi:hypothetical protein